MVHRGSLLACTPSGCRHSPFIIDIWFFVFTCQIDFQATGGGAYKFADLFKEKLGISIDKKDEMDCLVAGANFLLKVYLFYLNMFVLIKTITYIGQMPNQFVSVIDLQSSSNKPTIYFLICYIYSFV